MTTSQTFTPVYRPSDAEKPKKDAVANCASRTLSVSTLSTETSPTTTMDKSAPASDHLSDETLAIKRLDEITTDIVAKKRQIVHNFIEIGKLLIEAKEQTDKEYGKWYPWLCTVGIQPRTAQMYMQVAQAYPNTNLISHLGITKAHVLLALPEEKRQSFIEKQDVDKMSVRDLKAAIQSESVAESPVSVNNPSHQEKNRYCAENEVATDALDKFAQHLSSAKEQVDIISDFLLDKSGKSGDLVLQTTIRDAYGDLLRNLLGNIQQCIALVNLDEE